MIIIGKNKNPFEGIRGCFQNFYSNGLGKWFKWPIFAFISPGKCFVLIALLITLLLCGVGVYGLIVIILLTLLFIFIP